MKANELVIDRHYKAGIEIIGSKEAKLNLNNVREFVMTRNALNLIIQLELETFVQPIELTDKILLKCGFSCTWAGQGDGATYELKDKFIKLRSHDFTKNFVFTRHVWTEHFLKAEHMRTITTKVTYVHQLQNLYFALTGEELIIQI